MEKNKRLNKNGKYNGTVKSNVDLMATDYEWTCPDCGYKNEHSGDAVLVICDECGEYFGVDRIFPKEG